MHPTQQLLRGAVNLGLDFSLAFSVFVPAASEGVGVLLHNSCGDGAQYFAVEMLPRGRLRFKSSYGLDMCTRVGVGEDRWAHVALHHWLDGGMLRARFMLQGRSELAKCHAMATPLAATHGVPTSWKQSGLFCVGVSSGWHRSVQVRGWGLGACRCAQRGEQIFPVSAVPFGSLYLLSLVCIPT